MKILAIIVVALIVLPSLGLIVLSIMSRSPTSGIGLSDGRLRPCPDSPNCVVSEEVDAKAYIEPLRFEGSPDDAWLKLKSAITTIGGQIEVDEDEYLHATFRSRLFRFVDDLECRLDANAKTIHVRSASRVGHSDLGANRKRIERLRSRFVVLPVDRGIAE